MKHKVMGTGKGRPWARMLAALLSATLITQASALCTRAFSDEGTDTADESGDGEYMEEPGGEEDEGDEGQEDEGQDAPESGGYQDELDSLSDKLEDLKNKKADVQKKMNASASALNKKMGERSSQEEQIALTKEEISALGQRMSLLEQKIKDKGQEIERKQVDIDHNMELYKKRVRASYMAGESSALSMVLGASSFTDFLMRSEFVRATAEHDKELVDGLRVQRAELESAKAELEKSKVEVEQDTAAVKEREAELKTVVASISSAIQDISAEQEYYKQNKVEIDNQMKQVQVEMDSIYEKLKPQMSETFMGGAWAWPLPSHTQITSTYAANDRSDNHTGTDIAGGNAYGAKIVAANDGKVVYAASGNTGYGNYVIVDHGGGISSLYAHMSSISVSVGESVTMGASEIGRVGSTGWATGPHLHFEVRINGKPVNAMQYIS